VNFIIELQVCLSNIPLVLLRFWKLKWLHAIAINIVDLPDLFVPEITEIGESKSISSFVICLNGSNFNPAINLGKVFSCLMSRLSTKDLSEFGLILGIYFE